MADDVFIAITEIFSDIFNRSNLELAPGMKTGDIEGWDSFKNVEILIACETRWGIRFSSREIDQIRTLGDLKGCIEAKLITG